MSLQNGWYIFSRFCGAMPTPVSLIGLQAPEPGVLLMQELDRGTLGDN